MLVVKFKLSESGRRCLTNHVIWNDWKWGKIQPLMNPIERNPRMKQGRYTQLRTYYPAKHGWKGDVAMKEGRKGGRGNRRGRQALSKMGQGSPTPTGWPNTVCALSWIRNHYCQTGGGKFTWYLTFYIFIMFAEVQKEGDHLNPAKTNNLSGFGQWSKSATLYFSSERPRPNVDNKTKAITKSRAVEKLRALLYSLLSIVIQRIRKHRCMQSKSPQNCPTGF